MTANRRRPGRIVSIGAMLAAHDLLAGIVDGVLPAVACPGWTKSKIGSGDRYIAKPTIAETLFSFRRAA
jgi:hypothetical protein